MSVLPPEEGVSPVIAVVLLIAVVIGLAVSVGAFVFSMGDSLSQGQTGAAVSISEEGDGVHIMLVSSGSTPIDVLKNGTRVHTFQPGDVGVEVVLGGLGPDTRVSVVTNSSDSTLITSHMVSAATGGSGVTVSGSGSSTSETVSWNLGSDNGVATQSVLQQSGHVRLGYRASDSSLVSYWSMDGVSGSVLDHTGNGNDGSNNGATRGASGVLGTTSFDFAASEGDYVPFTATTSIPDNDESYAIVAWFNTPGGDCTCGLIGWGDYGNSGKVTALRLRGSGGSSNVSFRHYWWAEDLDVSTTTPYGGNWHQVVAQYDGSTREIWLDGTLIASDSPTTHDATRNNPSIGTTNTNEYWNGRLDEIRVYNSALTGSEIDQLYTGIKSGSYTTTWQQMTSSVDPSTLSLTNVSASLNGQSVTVYVESDSDGDGVVDETSTAIPLDGSGTYDVAGLSQSSDSFRLRVELDTSNITQTPTASTMDLTTG